MADTNEIADVDELAEGSERGAPAPASTLVPGNVTAPGPATGAGRADRRRRMWRRLRRRRLAMLGLVLVVAFLLLALVVPVFLGDPEKQDFLAAFQPASGSHPLGTDDQGRDLLARVAAGARVSLAAGVLSTAFAMLVGVPIGLVAGFYRRWLDPVVMRLVDVLLAFPFLVFAVGLAAILGPSLRNVVVALAVSQIPGIIRITRGEVLAIRELDFVSAAVADGAGDLSILFRYVLPNATSALIVQATVAIPAGILGEATLSFLGLGVRPPAPSWGGMLTTAQQFFTQAPWLAIWPGVMIALATLGFNLLGDGLRDVLDPRSGR
ncbi:ABC transporter permease [Micromonospora sp. NPDC049559]|uniref:ABC transporter permease n=1 Tax=Micromonospora sp. NPDC049559 TaxID=3155923 RepID=UPI00343C75E2